MINGMPEPTRVGLAADKRPHFVHFRFTHSLNIHRHLICIQRVQQSRVDRLEPRFFLLECTENRVGTDGERPGRIADPTGMEAQVNDEVSGSTSYGKLSSLPFMTRSLILGLVGMC